MNLFKAFRDLMPKATQIIATVQVEWADGTTSCLTLDNQLIRVKGANNRVQGQRVFIEINPDTGSWIVGDAPTLTGYNAEV